nr:MAG TPA: hypothetical protein [Caudoviricetes sp.]
MSANQMIDGKIKNFVQELQRDGFDNDDIRESLKDIRDHLSKDTNNVTSVTVDIKTKKATKKLKKLRKQMERTAEVTDNLEKVMDTIKEYSMQKEIERCNQSILDALQQQETIAWTKAKSDHGMD